VSSLPSGPSAGSSPVAASLPPKAHAPNLPRHLSDAEFVMLRGAGPSRRSAADELLFRKGELGHSMFVIETGEVRIEFGEGLPHKLLGPREYFGELALFIGNHSRVASAVAHTACSLRVVDYPAFDYLMENEPALLAQFMRRSFAYLVASEQHLIGHLKRRNEDLQVTLSSLRQTQSELSTANRLVRTDELTGLTNRRGLYLFLEELALHRTADTQLGLLLIDLDNFKRINDQCGHLVGDEVLRAVGDEVARLAGAGDMPCRIGGDEFALLAHVESAADLQNRAEHIVNAVRALRVPLINRGLSITVSVGGGMCAGGTDWSAWYSLADEALYRAKGAGSNTWHISQG
jgi:diguanylate cyclase